MKSDEKPVINVDLEAVDEALAEKLGRELEGAKSGSERSATGWSDPYRASGAKHN